MINGYVKLWRKVEDSEVFQDAALFKVWCWCLMRANYEDNWVAVKTGRGNTTKRVLRGQFIFGRKAAAKELRMKPKSVYNRMHKLESMGNLALNPDTHFSVVTICDYDKYQSAPSEVGQASGHPKDTQRTQRRIIRSTRKKKDMPILGKNGMPGVEVKTEGFNRWYYGKGVEGYAGYPRKVAPVDAVKAWHQALAKAIKFKKADPADWADIDVRLADYLVVCTQNQMNVEGGVLNNRDKNHMAYPASYLRGEQFRPEDEQ